MELKNVKLPGDKSLSHRALILAALRTGTTELENISTGEDVKSTLNCLRSLGVQIENLDSKLIVKGVGLQGFKKPLAPLDCGNSGTTMRLFMGLLAGQNFETVLIGDKSLSLRPMKRVAEPLRQMGACIELTNGNYAPIRILPAQLGPLKYDLPMASSQVKSALMLAAIISNQNVVLGGELHSRDHTERMLPYFFDNSDKMLSWKVPGDISSGSFWIAAGLLRGVKVKLEDVLLNPTRLGFINVLRDSGVNIHLDLHSEEPEPRGDITVQPSAMMPFRLGKNQIPYLIDEIPLLVLLATQISGRSVITGAEELRYKESDRIVKTAEVFRQLGGYVETTSDGFLIEGKQSLNGGLIDTFQDHRLTMMAAVAGLVCENQVSFSETDSAKVSDPYFFNEWKEFL